jgi:hypothetical protein
MRTPGGHILNCALSWIDSSIILLLPKCDIATAMSKFIDINLHPNTHITVHEYSHSSTKDQISLD